MQEYRNIFNSLRFRDVKDCVAKKILREGINFKKSGILLKVC